jgi:hypothetical protein
MKKTLYFILLFLPTLVNSQSWEWVKTFSSERECGGEHGERIGVDKFGNLYIKSYDHCATGGPNSSITQYNSILKYSASGDFINTVSIVNGWWREAIDPEGNIYVSANNFVKKYNPNGQLLWSDTIPGCYFHTMGANSKGVILSGRTGYPYCSDSSAYYMLDGNGNELWHRKGDFTPNCGDFKVHIDKNNNVYSATMTKINGSWLHYFIILDSLGTLTNKFQLTAFNTPNYHDCKIAIQSDKSIIVSGLEGTSPIFTTTIARYNPEGTLLWTQQLTGKGGIGCLKCDAANNIYIAGHSLADIHYQTTTITATRTAFVMKLNSEGSLIWEKHSIGTQGSAGPYDFALDSLNNIYMTGVLSQTHTFDNITATSGGPYSHVLIAKLSQPTVVASIQEQKDEHHLFSLNPNPGNGLFKIECSHLKSCVVRLSISNSLGQKVYSENHAHASGEYSKAIDMTGIAKGIYFVEINTGKERVVKKMVLQ